MSQLNRILLIEDDKIDIMAVDRAIKKLDLPIQLDTCENGEEGIAFLNENPTKLPDLILLDINMPKMNGFEFLDAIDKYPKLRLIPVVIVTTSKSQVDKMKGYEKKVAGYMVKPVDFNSFTVMVKSITDYWQQSEFAHK